MKNKKVSDDIERFWPGWEAKKLIVRDSCGSVYKIEKNKNGKSEEAILKVITLPAIESEIEILLHDGYDKDEIHEILSERMRSILREYKLLKDMSDCPNIIRCDDISVNLYENGLCRDIIIKMEYLTALTEFLTKDVTEKTVLKLAMDICEALIEFEKHNSVNLNVTPYNVFVTKNGDFKLGDYNYLKVKNSLEGRALYSHSFTAPEVYANKLYDCRADIYSLGLVLYWLLNERRLPFLPLPPNFPNATIVSAVREKCLSGENVPFPIHGSYELKEIVLKACEFNVEKRYSSATEMLKDLGSIKPVKDEFIPKSPMKLNKL